jgi:hypothetical protein
MKKVSLPSLTGNLAAAIVKNHRIDRLFRQIEKNGRINGNKLTGRLCRLYKCHSERLSASGYDSSSLLLPALIRG